ncbi:Gfo/Idh/MocA family protein [Paenibacillus thermotolerans]|uniref:Gfo/Idh/MocA family protein n=1 Tax=Paenibacillus thermotolerans TaxID=3027807 RepID=UPI00236865AA|nr:MULTISPECIES: Gfo/Idh/MocA family oxidoreductase [unclassified Paenibacillus]
MKPIQAILLGAGARGGFAYAPYAAKYPHELQFVAVAEPNEERRVLFQQRFNVPKDRCFSTWEELPKEGKIADAAFICTQDQMHYEPTILALQLGYDVLLEKPMSPDPEQCLEMERAANETGKLLTICHVLRYTPFWSTLKSVIDDGEIGEIASIQLNENVGFFHMAHSFVRGNWRNSDLSSPMILAKSCHDMDIISWLMDRECVRVSSFGSLMHFREENAPEGSTKRCLDGCEAEAGCAYSAPRFYLGEGKEWAKFFTENLSRESILEALRTGPYGRCVYRCDNNVVDHQVVNMEFEGGATATFSMCGFTHDCSRSIQIMGTKGEIRGYMESGRFTVYDFLTASQTEHKVQNSVSGHGGGDEGIVRDFLRAVRKQGRGETKTSARASVQSHLMAFAAERSRLAGGRPVNVSEFRLDFVKP